VKNANRQALRASATSVIERVRGFTWFYVEKRAGVEGWEKRGRAIFTRHRDGNWVVPLERSSHPPLTEETWRRFKVTHVHTYEVPVEMPMRKPGSELNLR